MAAKIPVKYFNFLKDRIRTCFDIRFLVKFRHSWKVSWEKNGTLNEACIDGGNQIELFKIAPVGQFKFGLQFLP